MKYRCFIKVEDGVVVKEPANWDYTISMFIDDDLWELSKKSHPDGIRDWYSVEIEDES